jgi:TetR/AcrR family transcriptional regulator, transcriptional repressor for nem operon
MENRSIKSERTRQFIIERTAEIFNKKGYAGTSISDITNATGLSKGGFYGNFESKEEVAIAAFDYTYNKLKCAMQERSNRADTFADKIMAYIDGFDRFQRQGFSNGGCPVLNTAVDSDDTNLLLKKRAAQAILSWKKNIEELFHAGVNNNEFRQGLDYTQMSISIIALLEGGIMIAKATDGLHYLRKIEMTIKLLIEQAKV